MMSSFKKKWLPDRSVTSSPLIINNNITTLNKASYREQLRMSHRLLLSILPALFLIGLHAGPAISFQILGLGQRSSRNGYSIKKPTQGRTISRNSHQFNGGYDASNVKAAKWTPLEAVEFVVWHVGDNYEDMGRQLVPLIENWSGKEWGEFMTRLYLGETKKDEFEVSFESRNVRSPKWKGLDTEEGLCALKDLLSAAFPTKLLEDPVEIARMAEVFLWKAHTWPAVSENSTTDGDLEVDSFACLGHTTAFVNIWKALCEERDCLWKSTCSSDNVLSMIPNPRNEYGAIQLEGMLAFFRQIEIRLTASEKIELVQGMAHRGWSPAKIAKFVSTFPEIPESERLAILEAAQEEPSAKKESEKEEANNNLFRNPFGMLDRSIPQAEKVGSEGEEETDEKEEEEEEERSIFMTEAALRINKAPTVAHVAAYQRSMKSNTNGAKDDKALQFFSELKKRSGSSHE